MAIIGVLIGLVLPAVQSAREAARRVACGNKLRQLAIAVMGYESVSGRFPPQLGWSSGQEGVGAFGTFFFHVLPQIEEVVLYDSTLVAPFGLASRTVSSISGSGDYTEYPNTRDSRHHVGESGNGVSGAVVPHYQCPSDASTSYVRSSFGWAAGSYGSNFQVFGNAPAVTVGVAVNTSNRPNLQLWEGRTPARNIADGLSKTIALAEKYGCCNAIRGLGSGADGKGGAMWSRWDWPDMWQPTFAADSSALGAASMFQDNPAPYVYPGPCNPLVPQTPHAGGVLMSGWLDGGIRGVASTIDPAVWWASITPRGGEVRGIE